MERISGARSHLRLLVLAFTLLLVAALVTATRASAAPGPAGPLAQVEDDDGTGTGTGDDDDGTGDNDDGTADNDDGVNEDDDDDGTGDTDDGVADNDDDDGVNEDDDDDGTGDTDDGIADDDDDDNGPGTGRMTGRLAGADRFSTAVMISQFEFPGTSQVVYLARADAFADALAGGSLTRGPILLVPDCGTVPQIVLDEIRRLNPAQVIALGGPAAVCEQVLTDASNA